MMEKLGFGRYSELTVQQLDNQYLLWAASMAMNNNTAKVKDKYPTLLNEIRQRVLDGTL